MDGNNEAEALRNIAEQSEERKATIAPGNSRTENEASYQDNIVGNISRQWSRQWP